MRKLRALGPQGWEPRSLQPSPFYSQLFLNSRGEVACPQGPTAQRRGFQGGWLSSSSWSLPFLRSSPLPSSAHASSSEQVQGHREPHMVQAGPGPYCLPLPNAFLSAFLF